MKARSIALVLAAALFSGSAFANAPACPADMDKNACVYFKEGYAVGKDDAKANLSNAYQRHEDAYDSRFESAFSKGYEQGWKDGKAKK
jgi:hypothetical protein